MPVFLTVCIEPNHSGLVIHSIVVMQWQRSVQFQQLNHCQFFLLKMWQLEGSEQWPSTFSCLLFPPLPIFLDVYVTSEVYGLTSHFKLSVPLLLSGIGSAEQFIVPPCIFTCWETACVSLPVPVTCVCSGQISKLRKKVLLDLGTTPYSKR